MSNLLKGLTTTDIAANVNPDIAAAHRLFISTQIVVPVKYLSSFFRTAGTIFVNSKIHLELNRLKNSIKSSVAGASTFQIASTKLHVPVVTLTTKDNVNLTKQLNEGFKRSDYWNERKSKIETKEAVANNLSRFPLDASFQGVNRLFVLAFDNTNYGANRVEKDSHRKYFLLTVNITNYNVLIDVRNFYVHNISDQIRKFDEVRKVMI